MTLKSNQRRARELAAKGLKPDDIAGLIGVSMRTVQRWFAKDRELAIEPSIVTDDPVTVTAKPQLKQTVETESVRLKAVEMFQDGLEVTVIAKELEVPIWTIQRWVLCRTTPEENQKMVSSLPPDVQQTFLTKAPDSPSWVEDTEQALSEHLECHRDIRRKLTVMLHNQLDSVEPNYRGIHVISQALIRHSNAERESLNVEWLDINRAMQVLRAYGLNVVDLAQVEALKRQRDPSLST